MMVKMGIQAKVKRKYLRISNNQHPSKIYLNIINIIKDVR